MAGLIGYFDLEKFWKMDLNKEEQKLIAEKYGDEDLLKGKVSYNGSASYFLANLSTYVNTKENYITCKKLIDKSLELLDEEKENIENLHYIYLFYIQFYYKNRDVENNLEEALKYCHKQVDIAPEVIKAFKNNEQLAGISPTHTGYEQLAIVYKKNKQWQKVVELCEKGKKEGWSNDFDKRIEEAKSKL